MECGQTAGEPGRSLHHGGVLGQFPLSPVKASDAITPNHKGQRSRALASGPGPAGEPDALVTTAHDCPFPDLHISYSELGSLK